MRWRMQPMEFVIMMNCEESVITIDIRHDEIVKGIEM
jgi:hypothetical protein